MTVTIFGIKNCDTMKKALAWMDEHGFEYSFVDYKKTGVVKENITSWCQAVGWETLLNRKGLTWKKLTDEERSDLNEKKAKRLMEQYPSMIKRPVLTTTSTVLVGFLPATYANTLSVPSTATRK